MADRSVATTDTLDTLRTTFNSTAGDVGDIASLLNASGIIAVSYTHLTLPTNVAV